MAIITPNTRPRVLENGQTGLERANSFIRMRTEGAADVIEALLKLATRAGVDATKPLTDAAKRAAKPVMELYKENISEVTGNLQRSVQIRDGKKKYAGVGIAVGGPVHVKEGKEWDVLKKAAGNHAWLYEFGTGTRKPGTQGRKPLMYVHQRVNGRMSRKGDASSLFNNTQFEQMGRGYYFLMGSKNNPHPERKTGRGAFVKKRGGGTRPMVLGPGDTYGAMPAEHAMEKAINRGKSQATQTLIAEIKKHMQAFQ